MTTLRLVPSACLALRICLWSLVEGRGPTLQKTSGKILTKNFGPVIESASEYLNSEAFEISWDLCHEFPYTMFLPFCWSMFPLLSTAPVPKWLTIGLPNLRKPTPHGPTSALSMTWVVLMQKSMGSFLWGWKIECKRVQLSAVFLRHIQKWHDHTQQSTEYNWIFSWTVEVINNLYRDGYFWLFQKAVETTRKKGSNCRGSDNAQRDFRDAGLFFAAILKFFDTQFDFKWITNQSKWMKIHQLN